MRGISMSVERGVTPSCHRGQRLRDGDELDGMAGAATTRGWGRKSFCAESADALGLGVSGVGKICATPHVRVDSNSLRIAFAVVEPRQSSL